MASLYTQKAHNFHKTFLLMALFLIVVISIAWIVSDYLNSPIILYIAVIIATVMNVSAYWYSDRVAIRLTRAKPVTRETHFDYWNIVENLCISIGAPLPKLYVITDSSPNAFATGRSPKQSAIVVTQGLLDMMDKNELEGVLAHELAHIQNRDTLLMTSVVVLFGVVTIILDFVLHSMLFGGNERDGGRFIFFALAAYLIIPIFLVLIKFAISRSREFQADASAGVYTRYPEGLASALGKIEKMHQPLKHASSATAHLFISDPFAASGTKKRGLRFLHLFDTHPPTEERIKALLSK